MDIRLSLCKEMYDDIVKLCRTIWNIYNLSYCIVLVKITFIFSIFCPGRSIYLFSNRTFRCCFVFCSSSYVSGRWNKRGCIPKALVWITSKMFDKRVIPRDIYHVEYAMTIDIRFGIKELCWWLLCAFREAIALIFVWA